MSVVTVWGTVPVAVVVDTAERTVLAVHVMDGFFRLPEEGPECYLEDGTKLVGAAARKAMEVVNDDSIIWPGWEWGW